jgi:hypothetical protein
VTTHALTRVPAMGKRLGVSTADQGCRVANLIDTSILAHGSVPFF